MQKGGFYETGAHKTRRINESFEAQMRGLASFLINDAVFFPFLLLAADGRHGSF